MKKSRRVLSRVVRDEAGVTIVEIMVSAFIVGISAVGVALMFSTGQAYVQAEGDNRVSLFLGQQKLEQLRVRGYAALAVTDTSAAEPPATATETLDLTAGLGTPLPPCSASSLACYTRTWSVAGVNQDNYTTREACPGSVCPGAKRIRVTVQTSPVDPKATDITLESVLANR
jgi:Tfp pilus assembly protein PilV